MAAIVFREFVEQNPGVRIVMVSRKAFADLFEGIPNVEFVGINLEDYKGFFGIRRLAKELTNAYHPVFVADLHDVIRTKILYRLLARRGLKIYKINKGKEEKEHLTDVWNLDKTQLKFTVERYADVFREMGFNVQLSHQYRSRAVEKSGIGYAPFAQHKGKMLPLDKSFEVAKILSKKNKIYFFGGGKNEAEILADWEKRIPNSENLAGKLSLKEELDKIASLEVMISMDSANMHLASLMGTRCVSVWGSTHHFAGFLGYGQSEQDIVHIKDLTCRPCSVFGDKECYRGDWACLEELQVKQIIDKI